MKNFLFCFTKKCWSSLMYKLFYVVLHCNIQIFSKVSFYVYFFCREIKKNMIGLMTVIVFLILFTLINASLYLVLQTNVAVVFKPFLENLWYFYLVIIIRGFVVYNLIDLQKKEITLLISIVALCIFLGLYPNVILTSING